METRLLLGKHVFHDPVLAEMARVADELEAQMALTYLAAAYAANMLGQLTTTGLYMSLHSSSPATTGANEILGSTEIGYSSGGYTGARQAITWGGVASGVVSSNDTQTFPLLATFASGIPYFGIWTDLGTSGHAGTYICGGATSGLSGSIPSGANVIFTNGITLTQSG
jgi:hypothetical protein